MDQNHSQSKVVDINHLALVTVDVDVDVHAASAAVANAMSRSMCPVIGYQWLIMANIN